MKYTINLGLKLPENSDSANVSDYNDNFKNIDDEYAQYIEDITEINNKIKDINSITTDQTYNPESANAQSGKAVNEAISGIQPIDEYTEFIFDGGDVDGGVSVDIVVDTVLSKTSNNPIANKPVATKFSEILEAIEQAKKDILLSAYPVGALFMSTANISPTTLFGGTWERIKGRFIWGIDDGETAGITGGEKTHTLTVSEMPEHIHYYNSYTNGFPAQVNGADRYKTAVRDNINTTDSVAGTQTNVAGENQPHNNMPPYYGSYIWRRTA